MRLNRTGDSGSGSSPHRRGQLDQHAVAGLGAEKRDASGQPFARRYIQQRHVLRPEPAEVPVDGRREKAEVMEPFAVLGEEARDARCPAWSAPAARSSCRPPRAEPRARPGPRSTASRTTGSRQRVQPEPIRLGQAFDHDADVMNIGHHEPITRSLRTRPSPGSRSARASSRCITLADTASHFQGCLPVTVNLSAPSVMWPSADSTL